MDHASMAIPFPDNVECDRLNRFCQSHFDEVVGSGQKLFTVATGEDGRELFDVYLDNLPFHERQHHDCRCCRAFFRRYGNIVTLDERGRARSPLFRDDAPGFYGAAMAALEGEVVSMSRRIDGIFVSSDPVWGTPVSSGWTHFNVRPPSSMVWASSSSTPFQRAAALKESHKTLMTALGTWRRESLAQAVNLLKSGTLYRAETTRDWAVWLLDLVDRLDAKKVARNVRERMIWFAVAGAQAGWTAPKSSVLGALLDDIEGGMDIDRAARRFNEKLDPEHYRRAQVAPTAGGIAQAEKLIREMGLGPSLERRYARVDELSTLWRPRAQKPAGGPDTGAGSVFGHLQPKARSASIPTDTTSSTATLTWDKFRRTVLPDALGIEAEVPASSSRFAALVTAVHPDAPPILAWDRDGARNPFSWYYASGIDGEMKRRVEGAGGQYENVDVRASLLWDNTDDLDLHVHTPLGDHIYYGRKQDLTGGYLDVDMNAGYGHTTKPVENIRWAKGRARPGSYRVAVWNFADRNRARPGTTFRLELEVGGRVFSTAGVVPRGRIQDQQVVATFILGSNGILVGEPLFVSEHRVAASADATWGLAPGSFVPVAAIAASPNLWGDDPMPRAGRHTFLLLDGCRDTTKGVGRGFFTETLRPELQSARKTLEAFTASAAIADAEGAPACGLGMSDQAPWDLLLKVRTVTGARSYRIDRRD